MGSILRSAQYSYRGDVIVAAAAAAATARTGSLFLVYMAKLWSFLGKKK